MDSQFSNKIKNLLSDPDSVKSLVEMASSLGIGKTTENVREDVQTSDISDISDDQNPTVKTSAEKNNTSSFTETVTSGNGTLDDEKIKLLLSIKPFLNDKKRNRVDSLVKALGAARIISTYKDLNLFG